MMSSSSANTADKHAEALKTFLNAINKARESFWYPVYIKPSDYADSIDTNVDDEDKKKKLIAKKKHLIALYPSSLEARTTLSREENTTKPVSPLDCCNHMAITTALIWQIGNNCWVQLV